VATADALTKRFFPGHGSMELIFIRFCIPGLLLLPMLWVAPLPSVPWQFWGWMGVAIPLEIVAMWLYVSAIRDAPLHLTLPFLAFTPVFNVLTAFVILGEEVSLHGFLGILLVVVGAYMLNLRHLDIQRWRQTWFAPMHAIVYERGSRLMLIVAAIYSLTSVVSKAALQYATPLSFGGFYYVAVGGAMFVFLLIYRPKVVTTISHRIWPQLAVGVAMAIMVVTHFLAIARVEVAYMVSVKRTSLLFGIAYGALLFGERNLVLHLFAGTVMVTGVAFILLAG
jgi:drug/metabolite transporter (DMT)-like permease